MPKDGEIVEVYTNPYLQLDASGEPQCVVPKGPKDGRGWYGATFDPKTGKFTVSGEPVRCCFSRYITERIVRGELIAANKKLANELGINFIEPTELLAGYRLRAIADYDAQHGEGAFVGAEKSRAEAVKAAELAAKQAAEAAKTTDQPAKARKS